MAYGISASVSTDTSTAVVGEAELKSRLRRVLTIKDYLREVDPNE